MKDDERVLLGDEVAQRQAPAVMLAIPGGQLANVEQQAKLFVDTGVAAVETQQGLFPPRQALIGKRGLAVKDGGLTHAAQSLRCIP